MTVLCKVHKQEMKLIPAGISKKTQKPYGAFYACTVYECKQTMQAVDAEKEDDVAEDKEILNTFNDSWLEDDVSVSSGQQPEAKPRQVVPAPKAALSGAGTSEVMTKDDWKAKDDRIRRIALAKEFIKAGVDFDSAVQNGDLLKWDVWTESGDLP